MYITAIVELRVPDFTANDHDCQSSRNFTALLAGSQRS